MDYAVVRAGGLQFRVSEGDVIRVPRIRREIGDSVELPEVLAVSTAGELAVGSPLVDGARVTAQVVGHGRARKVVVYKKKRRKGYQRSRGHRQDYTEIKITGVAA